MGVKKACLSLAVLCLLSPMACDSDEGIDGCEPGVTSDCACDGGPRGTQVCQQDNTYGACDCSGTAGTGGGGSGGAGGGGTGGMASGATGGSGGAAAGAAGASGAAGGLP